MMKPKPINPTWSASLLAGGALFLSHERRYAMDAINNHNGKTNDFPEAPASWNTRYVDPNGFECQITLRGDSGSELLEKATNAINYLLKNGCTPYVFYRNGSRQVDSKSETDKKYSTQSNGSNGSNGTNSNPAWCPIHQCEMKRWDKNGRVWYSHKVDGHWCNGK
jgi:hypothetical protein